jgi:hypothetical protein
MKFQRVVSNHASFGPLTSTGDFAARNALSVMLRLLESFPPGIPKTFKLFWDGTRPSRTAIEAIFLGPCVEKNFHSPNNRHVLAVGLDSENRSSISRLMSLAAVSELWEYAEKYNRTRTEDEHIRIFACADWIGIQRYLGITAPNISTKKKDKDHEEEFCFLCPWQKGKMQNGNAAYEVEQPYIEMEKQLNNSAFPIGDLRYDPLHGVARMLCLILTNLATVLDGRTATCFRKEICAHLVNAKMRSDKDAVLGSLMPADVANILRNTDLLVSLSSYFQSSAYIMPLNIYHNVHLSTQSKEGSVCLLLFSLREIFLFSRLRHPDRQDIISFEVARQVYIANLLANNWTVFPSIHYMLQHYPIFILKDRSSFFTLNEGDENAIGKLKKIARLGQGQTRRATQMLRTGIAKSFLTLEHPRNAEDDHEIEETHLTPLLDEFALPQWIERGGEREHE